jgi:hypothetical protein
LKVNQDTGQNTGTVFAVLFYPGKQLKGGSGTRNIVLNCGKIMRKKRANKVRISIENRRRKNVLDSTVHYSTWRVFLLLL